MVPDDGENRSFLNVGGNNKQMPIPPCYDGWRHDLLDIDPRCKPDVLCDAREICRLKPRQYDSIYCSHNLEHFYAHDLPLVLSGFRVVLKKDGFAYIRVPDLGAVMKRVVEDGLDLEDILYDSPSGSIRVSDVIYGLGSEIERSCTEFFAHESGFTVRSLRKALLAARFETVYAQQGNLEIVALAFMQSPQKWQLRMLGL
jgi:hypothetical protein